MCLQVFQRFVSRSLKRGSWTPEEDALLKELVNKMRIGNFIPYTQSKEISLMPSLYRSPAASRDSSVLVCLSQLLH